VVLSYDGDKAGKKATDRGINILTEAGIDVRVLRVTGAKDPDEYIKAFGADAFARLLKGSDTKIDYVIKNITSQYDIATDDGRIKAAKEFCTEIANVYSAVERELYTDRVAKLLGVSKESLESEIKKALRAKNREANNAFNKTMQNRSLGIGDRINPEHSQNPKAVAAEEAILGIMMLYPERVAEISSGAVAITEEDFVTAFNKRIFCALLKQFSEGKNDVSALGAEFTQEEMGRIYEMQVKRSGLDSRSDTVLQDNIYALKNAKAVAETDIDKIISAKLSGK
jgi:DNA primase